MPPLIMPCSARKRSSVRTNISKIALPIPRTSYFAEVIYQSCYGNCDGAENPLASRWGACCEVSRSSLRQQGKQVRPTSPRARGEVGIQAQLEFRVRGLSAHSLPPHSRIKPLVSAH